MTAENYEIIAQTVSATGTLGSTDVISRGEGGAWNEAQRTVSYVRLPGK